MAFTQDELSATALADLPGGYYRNRPDLTPPGLDIAFTNSDIDSAGARAVAAGAHVVTPVTVKPWGARVGYPRDLNGVIVEIGTPLGDAADTVARVAER